MFILGIIVNVVNNLPRLSYRHNLAICHVVNGISNHVGLLMKLLLLIMQMDSYISLNKPGKSKDHVDSLQVYGNKRTGGSNRTISGIGCLEGQLVLVVGPQGMTGERTKCLQNRFIGPKVQLF